MSDLDDDYDICDEACPKCGESAVRSRSCQVFDCDDGWIDEYHDDPINFLPGEEISMCHECCGTGVERWCSKCGCDITRLEYEKRKGGVNHE